MMLHVHADFVKSILPQAHDSRAIFKEPINKDVKSIESIACVSRVLRLRNFGFTCFSIVKQVSGSQTDDRIHST